mmetsp:Transcript_26676/g.68942  ORF Transcript_26676/g.68942 Transcript_26676/m.68942 type:complete len:390 (-) Transcript_26676:552-1721(-)
MIASWIKQHSWIRADMQIRNLIASTIDLHNLQGLHVLQLLGKRSVGWLKLVAMATPGRIDIYKNVLIYIGDLVHKSGPDDNNRLPRVLLPWYRLRSQVWLDLPAVECVHPIYNSMDCDFPLKFILFPLTVVLPIHSHQSNCWQGTFIDTDHVHDTICAQSTGSDFHSDAPAPQVRRRCHISLVNCLIVFVGKKHQSRHLGVRGGHHPLCDIVRKNTQGGHLATSQEYIHCVHVSHIAFVHCDLLIVWVEHEKRWCSQRIKECAIRRLGLMTTANLQVLLPSIFGINAGDCQRLPSNRCLKSVRPLRALWIGGCIAADHPRVSQIHRLGGFPRLPNENDITLSLGDLLQCSHHSVYIITPRLCKIDMLAMANSLPDCRRIELHLRVQCNS